MTYIGIGRLILGRGGGTGSFSWKGFLKHLNSFFLSLSLLFFLFLSSLLSIFALLGDDRVVEAMLCGSSACVRFGY